MDNQPSVSTLSPLSINQSQIIVLYVVFTSEKGIPVSMDLYSSHYCSRVNCILLLLGRTQIKGKKYITSLSRYCYVQAQVFKDMGWVGRRWQSTLRHLNFEDSPRSTWVHCQIILKVVYQDKNHEDWKEELMKNEEVDSDSVRKGYHGSLEADASSLMLLLGTIYVHWVCFLLITFIIGF